MILDRTEFSLWIKEYDKYVPLKHTWESFINNSIPSRPSAGLREQLKVKVFDEDIIIREMLDNISHLLLYHNIEFRKALRERLKFHKQNVNSAI